MNPKLSFYYIGRALSHSEKISGLEFGFRDNMETLLSVSEDRFNSFLKRS